MRVVIWVVASLAVFVAGVAVGNYYQVTDILCPVTATTHVLESDFESESGIIFPKGTVVPLRRCEYMNRFSWRFAIEGSEGISEAAASASGEVGFSVLAKKSDET